MKMSGMKRVRHELEWIDDKFGEFTLKFLIGMLCSIPYQIFMGIYLYKQGGVPGLNKYEFGFFLITTIIYFLIIKETVNKEDWSFGEYKVKHIIEQYHGKETGWVKKNAGRK